MKAVRIHAPGKIEIDELSMPTAGPDDIVVRVKACGICGSDLTYAKIGGVAGPANSPMALGHEFAGVVHETGTRVRGVRVGERVVVNPYANAIGNGGPEGGFADFVLVRNADDRSACNVRPIPETMSAERAALTEPLSVGLHAVNRSNVKPGERVAVFGAGPIGLAVVAGLRRRGVADIVVIDLSPRRLELARKLGAKATINAASDDILKSLTKFHGVGNDPHLNQQVCGTDLFIEASGAAPVIPTILQACQMKSRITIVAVHEKPITVDLRLLLAREISLAMSIGYPDGEFDEVLEMLRENGDELENMVTHRYPFSEFVQAFSVAQSAELAAKVMVRFEDKTV